MSRNKKEQEIGNETISKKAMEILREYGYSPNPLNKCFTGTELWNMRRIGVDVLIYTNDISRNDPLNFKQMKPIDKDWGYYSINYRSNNFENQHKCNDEFIFVKLMELSHKSYNRETLMRKQRRREKSVRINGILSNKNPDYNFYIKDNSKGSRDEFSVNSLINAYLVPINPLREQIIANLNQIRKDNDYHPLKLDNNIIDSVVDIYETWELYDGNDKKYDNFELLRHSSKHIRRKPDLMMRIMKDDLPNYVKFGLNGEIVECKP